MANRRPYINFAEVKQKVSIPDVLTVFGIADRFQTKGDTKLSGCWPAHRYR